MNKKERAAFEAACEAALDQGRDHFRQEPEAMLCEVSHVASALFADKDCAFAHLPFYQKEQVFAFLEGYQQARAQREAFLKESGK